MVNAKPGFNGQWVQIFRAGKHTDNKGKIHDLPVEFVEQVAKNFDQALFEPPATIGHPEEDAPAYAWVSALRRNDDLLEAQFCDTDPAFEEMVRNGRFKTRSAAFYLSESLAPGGRVPSLRHVAFLGAQPPAVKGLRNIHFSEDEGEVLIFEEANFSEGENMAQDKEKTVKEQIADYFRELFGGSKDGKQQTASFSEEDRNMRIEKAVTAVEARFTEKITTLEETNKNLAKQVGQQSHSTRRAEIVAFCEQLGPTQFPPAFKQMGAVEFMEALAALPTDNKVVVINFSEKDGQKTETKTETPLLDWFKTFLSGLGPFIEFGEKFGNMSTNTDGGEVVDPKRMEKLRDDMGLEKKEKGGAK